MSTIADRTFSRLAIPRTAGWGMALAGGAALISGLAVYLNSFGVKQLPDAAVYTTLKNAIAAIVLVGAALAAGNLGEARAIERRRWPAILLVGAIGGSIPFVLFFTGMAQASAPSAAFIHKTLFIWVALLAVPLLGERLGLASVVALGVLVVGQALVLPPSGIEWGRGETLILLATLFWAAETVLVKHLLGSVSSHLMAALRMGVGLIVLVGFLTVTGKIGVVAGLTPVQWGWVLLTGLILASYVGTWFAALQRAPASIVTSVLVLGAVVTGAFNGIAKGVMPEPAVVGGYLLIVGAAAILAGLGSRTTARPASEPLRPVAADARLG